LVDPDKLEPFKDGKGFKIFTATSVAALAASLTYWVALFRAMARTLVASNRQFLVATIVSVVAFSVINALLNLIVAF